MPTPKKVTQATKEDSPITPMQMLQVAVERGADLEHLEKLMELERRWKADKARDAYIVAMNAFRSEVGDVTRSTNVSFGQTKYDYATLANVLSVAVPKLSEHGLSHRWDTSQDGEKISVTCIVTHELGHSEKTTLSASADTSGGKNSIQAIGSTVSYLERYTFMAITGLAARDQDNDGGGAVEPISAEQAANIEALLSEVAGDTGKFLKWAKVGAIADIPAKSYDGCIRMIEAKRRA